MKNKTLKRLLHLFMALSFAFTLWGKKHYSEETISRYMEEVDTLFAAIRHFRGGSCSDSQTNLLVNEICSILEYQYQIA